MKAEKRSHGAASYLQQRASLRQTLLLAFLLLTLPPLVAISAVTIWRQYQASRGQILDQLTSVATLKETEVKTWYNSLAPDLELVVANPRVRSDITQLIATQHNEFVSNAWRGVLLDTLTVARTSGHKFEEIFLLDDRGQVIVSTIPTREGQSFETQPFFQQGLIAPYVQTPSSSPANRIAIFAAVPVRDEKNAVQAVLAGSANLDALNTIMKERAGLGRTGETYLVSVDHLMLTEPRAPAFRTVPVVRSQGANGALSGRNGAAFYENYQSPPVPVVGVYRWIPELRAALLAEQSQAEAFEATVLGLWTSLGLTLLVAILTFVSALAVSRSLATPLEHLTAIATRIASGDLTQSVEIERRDEIGTLATTFNAMTAQLRELIANLEQRVLARTEELQQELAERRRVEDGLQKARNDLSALYEVTATSSQAFSLPAMLTRSLAQTVDALHSDGGIAFLADENQSDASSRVLRLVAHQGIAPRTVEQMNAFLAHSSLASTVIDRPEPLLIPDVSMDDRAPEPMRQMGKVGMVLAPMRADRQVWGILAVTRRTVAGYRAEEIALLTSIADQIGVAVRSDHLRQRAQQATILEERQRLARVLHDSVTQMLYSVMLFAEAAVDSAERADLVQVGQYLMRLRETAQQALREMRLLIYESRPQELEQEGLVGALRRRLEVVENRSGVVTELLTEGPMDLPSPMQIELYGIAQEALNNILKHSAATRVTVHLQIADRVQLQITDNGKGFASQGLAEKAGIGLVSMRERAERLGGTLQIDSAPGEGTCVRLCVPLKQEAPENAPAQEEQT